MDVVVTAIVTDCFGCGRERAAVDADGVTRRGCLREGASVGLEEFVVLVL